MTEAALDLSSAWPDISSFTRQKERKIWGFGCKITYRLVAPNS